jgi:3'-phosphoadenosine 5'-phosphosulfate sulfotransferase (PAPS reductase)/FAD synthetase
MKSGKGLPSIFRRWCCETLKHSNPKLVQYRVNIIGVRGEESKARMERGEISVFGDSKRARNKKEALKKTFASTSSEITCEGGKDKVNIYPIFDLTEKEVWEIIKTENLTLPEPYQNGCGVQRLGCSFCPFESYHENIKTIKTNPNIVKAWLRTFDDEFIRTSQKVFYGRVDGVDLFMLYITGNICNMNVANNYLRSIKSKNIFGTTDKGIFINYLKECGI